MDKTVRNFINLLKFYRGKNIKDVYINLDDFGQSDVRTKLQRKIKFVYTSFIVESRINSGCVLIFNDSHKQDVNGVPEHLLEDSGSEIFDGSFGLKDFSQMTDGYNNIQLPNRHEHVVLGGTFDRFHNGHRLLLSVACLIAKKSISIGITSDNMVRKKCLSEMIEPFEIRKTNVKNYVSSSNPSLILSFDKLEDGVGFSGTDPSMDTLITTTETKNGEILINKVRSKNLLTPVEHFIIESTVPDPYNFSLNSRLNSTQLRWNELGKLIRPSKKPTRFPYVVGLTGCIASGKSSVCEYLRKLGAIVINCDLEAHACYLPGTECYAEIVKYFGSSVVVKENGCSNSGAIDRKALGGIVFKDSKLMDCLNRIVWPHLYKRVVNMIDSYDPQCKKVILLESTILFESKLNNIVNEIWLMLVSENLAIERVQKRNLLDYESAKQRYDISNRLMSSFEKAKLANVLLSTHSNVNITHQLVRRAYDLLLERIGTLNDSTL